jgi:hypothetical protein
VIATPVLAQTTSVQVVKLASDGTTVIDETTVDYAWMEAELPVQGNGSTHYYHQGPTFDPENLWDPDETVNLKDKGAVKGTAIRDLCDLVGGATPGDTVRIKAIDNFTKEFSYEDIYSPEQAQGLIVLCWYRNGQYVPSFDDGMQLIFFAQTLNGANQTVFGNWDMHECLAEQYRHYFSSGGVDYPSSNGLTVKYVSEITIFSSTPPVEPGDANGDGDINMQDVTYTELIILGYTGSTGGADANGDGDVNMGDVTTIELMILGYL